MQPIEKGEYENGNEKGSQESTCEEGREEDREKEVVATNNNRQTQRGRFKASPQCFCRL
jgi:hypothetical protein